MNNNGTTPNDILNWIKEKEGGKYDNYNKCKEDTEEAIEVFDGLYGKTFATPYKLFEYLYSELKMRVSNEHQSFYRAFLVINKDEIISIRLAQHYSTKNSTRKGFRDNGKPDVEYHLLIDCHQPITPQNDIYFDRIFSNVSMKIRDFDLSDFNDGHIRRKILDEIIRLLTYGTATNENKQYNKKRQMKQTIRLTESELRQMIAESVKRVLRENYDESEQETLADNNELDEGAMSDIWGGIKRGVYQMTHRPQAMNDYDRRNSSYQTTRDNYDKERRNQIINRREGRGAQAYKDQQIDKRLGLGRYRKS